MSTLVGCASHTTRTSDTANLRTNGSTTATINPGEQISPGADFIARVNGICRAHTFDIPIRGLIWSRSTARRVVPPLSATLAALKPLRPPSIDQASFGEFMRDERQLLLVLRTALKRGDPMAIARVGPLDDARRRAALLAGLDACLGTPR
jgi:hypothetical protein